MTESTLNKQGVETEELTVPLFGYDLIREDLLQDLLGKETGELLYWAGKRLARNYPLKSYEEVIAFFQNAGWGSLQIKNDSKSEIIFELESEHIKKRVKSRPNYVYSLEAGFLAQQIEFQTNSITEAFEHPKKKGGKVQFTVKWDVKDPIDTL